MPKHMVSHAMVVVGVVVDMVMVIASVLVGLAVVAGTNPRLLNVKPLLLQLLPSQETSM